MQQVLNEVGQIAQRLAGVIWQVLQFIWNWSFGQVVKMFQMPFNNLPLWKQVLFVVVIAALAYFLYKVAKDLLKAVQSVLGAILIDRDAVVEVAEFLRAADFYRQANGTIYGAILELFERREPIDIVTVSETLERSDQLEGVGGRAYLSSLTNSTPTARW